MPLDPPCWHKNIDDDGICPDCGRRAAIKLEPEPEPVPLLEPEPDHVPLVERLGNQIAALHKNIADLLRRAGDQKICKCGAEIYFLKHHNGARTPYSLDGANHFTGCPDREQFRRKKHA